MTAYSSDPHDSASHRPQKDAWWQGWQDDGEALTMGRVLGIGALVAGGATLVVAFFIMALLIGPLIFWFAWNVLDFGPAVGLPELGFWAIILATVFLTFGWFGKMVVTGFVFLINPSWFQSTVEMTWPEPTIRNFIAIALLAVLAARPHARAKKATKKATKKA